ncbi:MAG: LicD family protein [Clostridiales bacterium]|nr:LicD family protein [Clostridiales bacterium]
MSGTDGFLSITEEQQAELEVMKELHSYCVKHGLKYVLGYGTLLGAVRHQGFIPWDNDMDILMPRSDVEKLVELNKTEPIGHNIRLFHYTTDKNYHYPIVRACNMKTIVQPTYLREQIDDMGVWVDVFPLDGISRPKLIFQKPLRNFYLKMMNATMYVPESESGKKEKLRSFIIRHMPDKNHKYERHLSSVCAWSKYEKAKTVCVICEEEPPFEKQLMDREDVENPMLAPYEDAEFFIPRNADKYLTLQYGDYMQLPPEEDRMTHSICSRYK